ncbi:hypothetical protein PsorP6_010385 [Peronosclerospora sorghi]|uniref:Uncharacterized protein n=1 Tax=Peronosclerospora sorghi TaxID=230839 RepID=A0ACC0VY06_9STRA|nr:hypothetical protein PsorP6_010385 [Peronosclerospora sorghi]
MKTHRFLMNPFQELKLTTDARAQLVEITDAIILEKFEEYEEHVANCKRVDLHRWKKIDKSGPLTVYLERKSSNPNSMLPNMLTVGPLPGSLDENMFGIVNPTIEAMRIKTSYLKDFSAAAVLATIVEPTVDDPFRSVVVKWVEIDIPLASLGIVRNRDYVCIECTGIMLLKNGDRVGYHLLHSVHFPEAPALPNRVRGNLSLCAIFHQEVPDQTDCHGTGIMDPGGDMVRSMAMVGMVNATMAGLKYSYCGQMKKLVLLLEQRQTAAREPGSSPLQPVCTTCMKDVKSARFGRAIRTCKLCFNAVCISCKIAKRLSFIAPDLTLVQRKVTFCVKCIIEATQMDTQEAAREQFVYKKSISFIPMSGFVSASDSSSESSMSTYSTAAAVLATIVEPTVDDPFRSVVVKWMEIDIPLASLGIVRNRDYVYIECTGILWLKNGDRVGYHLFHSANFPETPELPNRVRGNMSFCAIFHQEAPDQTDIRGTGIVDPGGDMIRAVVIAGMGQMTTAGLKYSYCAQMKKLTWLLEQRQAAARETGFPPLKPVCTTCKKDVKSARFGRAIRTCKLCFNALCSSCKVSKRLSFIAPDLTLVQRKVTFCVKCILEATQMDTQEAAREQFVYKKSISFIPMSRFVSASDSSSDSTMSSYST